VLKGDGPEAAFWTSWVANNTNKLELINQARAVIHALQQNGRILPDLTVDSEVHKVLQKLREGRLNLVREIPNRPRIGRRPPNRTWTIAAAIAAVAIICILAGVLRHYLRTTDDFYAEFLTANPQISLHQQTAGSGSPLTLTLPDSSKVRLAAGSKLSFTEKLGEAGHREVFLEGEALFTISPRITTPFLIYTHSTIVKAVGSSFTVNTNGARTTVTVAK
jgi:ferric-dicitrate binding protein FerR (iron transport regulator)